MIPANLPPAALVTGAGKRLGRAMALALAEAGFDVAIHYAASAEAAEATAADIRALGRRAITLKAELGQEAEVSQLIPTATKALGPLGVLVNNASTFERDEWQDATRESWDRHIEPNLRAPFVLTQDFAKALPEAAQGLVVNMLDQRVWSLTPHFVSYTVSKAGLWALTQSLALALAPRIRVNAIGHGQRFGVVEELQAIQVMNVAVGLGSHGNQLAQNLTDAPQRQLADPFVAAEGLPLNHSVEARLAWAWVVFVRGATDRRNYKNWRGRVGIANRVDEAVHGRAEGARG